MTNYNERLDKILSDYAEAMGSYVNFGSPFNSDEDNIAGAEALYQTSQDEAKQALTSLIKELVEEAIKKPHILPQNAQHQESVKQGINFYHRQMRKRVDKLKEQL